MKTISFGKRNQIEHLAEAVDAFLSSRSALALTGAGISVNSGIADFRSPGGVWTVFSPDEYATLEVFLSNPAKAWKLYRELGRALVGKEPNSGHFALADLEKKGRLNAIITQNVDNLHQSAGSKKVLEIHGDHQHLHCLQCGHLVAVQESHLLSSQVPGCELCSFPLKPNVVLFGEAVRSMEEIQEVVSTCDALLVIGTSAQIYPAAGLPIQVKQQGGVIFEFNLSPSLTGLNRYDNSSFADYFIDGDLSSTLPRFCEAVLKE